jgi:hypothetical protein
MLELVERRIFGAIEFVHGVTGARVLDELRISAPGLGLLRNRSGFYVIREAQGMDAYTRAFDAPPALPRVPFTLTVRDPNGRFQARSVDLRLPRVLPQPEADPPVEPDDEDNALKPLTVRLWPSAALPLQPGWAVARIKVAVDGIQPDLGLANVLVEVTPQVDGAAVQRALTDRHGEALVVIPDVAPILPDAGPVGLTRQFEAGLRLVLDDQVVRPNDPRAPDAAFPVANPDAILRRRDEGDAAVAEVAAASNVVLSAGASARRVEKVAWP